MGFSGAFSFWHWVILLIVVVLVFGTKRLATLGTDVGEAVKSFRHAVRAATEDEASAEHERSKLPPDPDGPDARGPTLPS